MGCLISKEIREEEESLQADIGIPASFVDYNSTHVAVEDNAEMYYLVKSNYF
jgi:hypothetical protein